MTRDTITAVLLDAVERSAEISLSQGHDRALVRLGVPGGRYRFTVPAEIPTPTGEIAGERLNVDPDTHDGLDTLSAQGRDFEAALRSAAAHTLTRYFAAGELSARPTGPLDADTPTVWLTRAALRATRVADGLLVCFLNPPWPGYAAQAQEALDLAVTSGISLGGPLTLEVLRWDYTGDGSMEPKLMMRFGDLNRLRTPDNAYRLIHDRLDLPADPAAARRALSQQAGRVSRLVQQAMERHLTGDPPVLPLETRG